MAGRGPAPKDPSVRQRRNRPTSGDFRVVEIRPGKQPELVDVLGETNPRTGEPWRKWTLDFWAQLADFPSTKNHLPAQWSSLARAVAFEEASLLGVESPSEGRLRVAKHGVDPDDLMRLRILTVEAEVAEEKVGAKKPAAKKKPSGGQSSDARLALVQ